MALIQMLGKPRPLGRGRYRARSQRLRFPNDIGDTVLQGGEDVHKTAEKWTEKAKEAIANEAERYEKEIGL